VRTKLTWPLASTQVAGVIGDPVGHSLSPVLHNAAFNGLGLDWVYVALAVPAGQVLAALAGVRAMGIRGLSVTMPHKSDVAAGCEVVTPVVERLGVANTVVNHDGRLLADNTDGAGLIDCLRLDQGFDPLGTRAVVLGTGGAARAAALALDGAGAAEIVVVGRKVDAAAGVVSLCGSAARVGLGSEEIDRADLVVNATPVGMAHLAGKLPLDLEPARLGPGQLVLDMVYAPPVTPLIAAARRQGARSCNGTGMLLHQAGRQFSLWTGMAPPLALMAEALDEELARRGG
jgi:shikimate dehydrogenase